VQTFRTQRNRNIKFTKFEIEKSNLIKSLALTKKELILLYEDQIDIDFKIEKTQNGFDINLVCGTRTLYDDFIFWFDNNYTKIQNDISIRIVVEIANQESFIINR